MGAEIRLIEYYLPQTVITNQDLEREFPEWSSDKIAEKVGIRQRHVVRSNETALDLAVEASKKLLVSVGNETIDFVLLCTQSPDYFLPTSACILQKRLDLRDNIGALDFNLGCSGFVYGLAIAKGLIESKIANNILLVTSETYSRHIHKKDKSNRSIFGDAAAACLVSKSENNTIFDFELGTDGNGMNNLIVKNGGLRNNFDNDAIDFVDESGVFCNNNNLYMNGPEIFNFTIQRIPKLIRQTLEKNGITMDDIDFFVFHQANKFMLEYLKRKMKIPTEKFYMDMESTGNTVSSTIPIALKDSVVNGLIKNGDKVLIAGFGVGYSWGATIIQF